MDGLISTGHLRLVFLVKLLTQSLLVSHVLEGALATPKDSVAVATPTASPPAKGKGHFIIDTASLDLNQDGCIDGKAEMDLLKNHVIAAMTGSTNRVLRAHSIVHRTDVNRDGRICWCDFIAIYLHDKSMRNKHSVPFLVLPDSVMFLQLDINNDGKLSGDESANLQREFASCLPQEQAQLIVKTMAEMVDEDESISRDEFDQFFNLPHQTRPVANDQKSIDVQGQDNIVDSQQESVTKAASPKNSENSENSEN